MRTGSKGMRFELLSMTGILVLLFAASCNIAEIKSDSERAPELSGPLRCISPADILKIKQVDDKNKLRAETLRLYYQCQNELFRDRIPIIMGPDEKLIIFSSILSHNLAPYGSSAQDLEILRLVKAETLECSRYAMLAAFLFENAASKYEGEIIFVGFDGGFIGNHAQIIFKTPSRSILLDPTVGIVAFIGYNGLLRGNKLQEDEIYFFYSHPQNKELAVYFYKVKKALLKGLYKPSDALYYYVGLDNYLNQKNSSMLCIGV